MRNVYQFYLLVIFAVILTSCSGGGSPILPNQNNSNTTFSANNNNIGSPTGNPFEGIPVDEPYDNYTIQGETFSISAEKGFQRKGLVYGLNAHEVISHLNSVQMDDISSIASVEFSLHNAGSIIYDAHLVIDEILPSGSEAVDIDGLTPNGKPFWNFGIIPAGKTSPVRNLQIRFSSNQDVSVSGHIEFKERAYVQWDDFILHTDGFDDDDIINNPNYGQFVSNEVIAGIPDGSNISDVYDYLKANNLMPVGFISPVRCMELRITDNAQPLDVIRSLDLDSFLVKPELNPIFTIDFFPDEPIYDEDLIPTDNYRWAYERIQAVDAWDWYSDGVIDESGNANVNFGTILVILDTGIINHDDFELDWRDEWVIDNLGRNFINTDNPPTDDHGHGTSVAGIAGATGNNGATSGFDGMSGVAWNPIFLPMKVMNSSGRSSGFSVETGMAMVGRLAIDYPWTKVISNLSLGRHSQYVPYWFNIVVDFLNIPPNTLTFAAAGNYKNDKDFYGVSYDISADNFYPAALEGCVSVGASSRLQDGGLDIEVFEEYGGTWGTNWGDTVELCAPGSSSVYTTHHHSTTDFRSNFGGTSGATPFVAGTAALLWSQNPQLTKNEILQKLTSSTDPMSLPAEKVGKLGSGRLNVYNAVSGQIIVTFPDPNLEAVIREIIGKPTGNIFESDLETITLINADRREISNLEGLQYCTNMTYLRIKNNPSGSLKISDLTPLQNLYNIENLYLMWHDIDDLTPLQYLTDLIRLDLTGNQIVDVFQLRYLTNLTYLWLKHNEIVSISPLDDFVNLEYLDLGYNSIDNISVLGMFADNLTYLNLTNNPVRELTVLRYLTNLVELHIRETHADISALQYLVNLEVLWIGGPLCTDISVLQYLPQLKFLWLGYSPVSDITSIESLVNVTDLWLWFNDISDITPLQGLQMLAHIKLGNNEISDILPLVNNLYIGSGDYVDLSDNPLSQESIDTHIPALQSRGVDVIY